jgi:hypothetical protein
MPNVAGPMIHIDLTEVELLALIKLAEDQLFRIKFIDPKMPGHRRNAGEVASGEAALSTLKTYLPKHLGQRSPSHSDVHLPKKSKTS